MPTFNTKGQYLNAKGDITTQPAGKRRLLKDAVKRTVLSDERTRGSQPRKNVKRAFSSLGKSVSAVASNTENPISVRRQKIRELVNQNRKTRSNRPGPQI